MTEASISRSLKDKQPPKHNGYRVSYIRFRYNAQ